MYYLSSENKNRYMQIQNYSPLTKKGSPQALVITEGYELSTTFVDIEVDEDGIAHMRIFLESDKGHKLRLSFGHSETQKLLEAREGKHVLPWEQLKLNFKTNQQATG